MNTICFFSIGLGRKDREVPFSFKKCFLSGHGYRTNKSETFQEPNYTFSLKLQAREHCVIIFSQLRQGNQCKLLNGYKMFWNNC